MSSTRCFIVAGKILGEGRIQSRAEEKEKEREEEKRKLSGKVCSVVL